MKLKRIQDIQNQCHSSMVNTVKAVKACWKGIYRYKLCTEHVCVDYNLM